MPWNQIVFFVVWVCGVRTQVPDWLPSHGRVKRQTSVTKTTSVISQQNYTLVTHTNIAWLDWFSKPIKTRIELWFVPPCSAVFSHCFGFNVLYSRTEPFSSLLSLVFVRQDRSYLKVIIKQKRCPSVQNSLYCGGGGRAKWWSHKVSK